jgi:hypothetical protein
MSRNISFYVNFLLAFFFKGLNNFSLFFCCTLLHVTHDNWTELNSDTFGRESFLLYFTFSDVVDCQAGSFGDVFDDVGLLTRDELEHALVVERHSTVQTNHRLSIRITDGVTI